MAQHINLYRQHSKTRVQWFSGRGLALIGLVLSMAVGLTGLIQIRQTTALRAQIESDKRESARLQKFLAETATGLNQSERLATEEADIRALEAVATRLTAGVLGRAGSFTESLKGLARATYEGVWLTGIELHQTSGQLALEGKALDASRIPKLLAALGQQPQFAGTTFAALDITLEADQTDRSLVSFRITSTETQAPTRWNDEARTTAQPRAEPASKLQSALQPSRERAQP
ncbi:MAG TPA: PilN domain-containing protein [Burkholderiaceae bacterium]|nr:PilN domain-containing protein [Burkholderiaceae bacterium]